MNVARIKFVKFSGCILRPTKKGWSIYFNGLVRNWADSLEEAKAIAQRSVATYRRNDGKQ